MTDTNLEAQLRATMNILNAIIEVVQASGPLGTPEGHLYAHLMPLGCTLPVFNQMVGILVKSGRVTKTGNLLRAAA